MGDYSTRACLVYDLSSFCEVAVKLAESWGTVYYYTPGSELSLPTEDALLVGKGIPGVERVDYWTDVVNDCDLVVCPDILSGPVQMDILERGKRVFGSRLGDEFEIQRAKAKEYFKSIGLNVGPYEVVVGVPALRKYLQSHKDVWVKSDRCRGSIESFCAKSYAQIELKLDAIEHDVGPKKNSIVFSVEENIPNCIELGNDTYSIDGQFPKSSLCGIEQKGTSYLAHFASEEQTPEQLKGINAAFGPALKAHNYRNFFCVETRIDHSGKPWILDPCCRMGAPSGGVQLEMFTNLADIIWEGAGGKCIEPIPAASCAAEVIISANGAEWNMVEFPEKYRKNVKLRFLTVMNNHYYCVPQLVECGSIGSIVAVGNTFDSVIAEVTEIASKVSGYGITVNTDSLQSVKKDFGRLKEYNIAS